MYFSGFVAYVLGIMDKRQIVGHMQFKKRFTTFTFISVCKSGMKNNFLIEFCTIITQLWVYIYNK